jgi:hypothetical protein
MRWKFLFEALSDVLYIKMAPPPIDNDRYDKILFVIRMYRAATNLLHRLIEVYINSDWFCPSYSKFIIVRMLRHNGSTLRSVQYLTTKLVLLKDGSEAKINDS